MKEDEKVSTSTDLSPATFQVLSGIEPEERSIVSATKVQTALQGDKQKNEAEGSRNHINSSEYYLPSAAEPPSCSAWVEEEMEKLALKRKNQEDINKVSIWRPWEDDSWNEYCGHLPGGGSINTTINLLPLSCQAGNEETPEGGGKVVRNPNTNSKELFLTPTAPSSLDRAGTFLPPKAGAV